MNSCKLVQGSWSQGHYVEQHSRAELQVCTYGESAKVRINKHKTLNGGRCNYGQDHQHGSYCSHLLEHVLSSAGSETLPRSRRGHRTYRCTALSTVSHGPSRYPMVTLVVLPTEPSRVAAGELGKGSKNLEGIGAKFLCPNCFLFFIILEERLLRTFS